MSEQQFWKTAQRHSCRYLELIAELQRLDAYWPKLDAFMTAAAAAGDFGPDSLAMIGWHEFMRDCDHARSCLVRLQSRMRKHLALAPPGLMEAESPMGSQA